MNRLEHTARMLAGLGTGSPDLEPGIRSARRSLAWSSEMAAAAAGAGRGPELIAWAMYAMDERSKDRLAYELMKHVEEWKDRPDLLKPLSLRQLRELLEQRVSNMITVRALHVREAREIANRHKLRDMTAAVVAEWLNPPKCRKCRGTGNAYRKVQGRVVETDCEACNGHGTVALSGRARARRVGVSEAMWRRYFVEVYDRMLGRLDSWNVHLLLHVSGQLRDCPSETRALA